MNCAFGDAIRVVLSREVELSAADVARLYAACVDSRDAVLEQPTLRCTASAEEMAAILDGSIDRGGAGGIWRNADVSVAGAVQYVHAVPFRRLVRSLRVDELFIDACAEGRHDVDVVAGAVVVSGPAVADRHNGAHMMQALRDAIARGRFGREFKATWMLKVGTMSEFEAIMHALDAAGATAVHFHELCCRKMPNDVRGAEALTEFRPFMDHPLAPTARTVGIALSRSVDHVGLRITLSELMKALENRILRFVMKTVV